METQDQREKRFRIIAHELKTPIAAVIQLLSAAELSLADSGDIRTGNLVRRARKRAVSALEMVKNLLEYSRQREKNTGCVFDPSRSVAEMVREHSASAIQRKVRIIPDLMESDFSIAISEVEFTLIVNNLISNAVRYSKRDGAMHSVRVKTRRSGNAFILSVQDHGIGMTETDKKNLFNEFYRSRIAREQTVTGSGLGMAIVGKIIAENNAKIFCDSVLGHGTTFTVHFPIVAE